MTTETPTGRRPLSLKQREILDALIQFVDNYGYQPSFAELAQIVGVSNVQTHITAIEAKGWIRCTGKPRAIVILPETDERGEK